MRTFCALALSLLIYTCSFSQTILVKGQVKTKADSVMPGVSVTIKGTDRMAVTNKEGEFAISAPKLPAVLIFSYVGYQTQAFSLKKADTTRYISIKLGLFETNLAEVVVIGYGTARKKATMTASVSTVRIPGSTPSAAKAYDYKAGKRDEETVKKLRNDSELESNLKRQSKTAPANSKILTAGELSDFKKWKLWGNYGGAEFKMWSEHWGVKPVNRYCVQVQNKDYKGLVGEKVYLVNTTTNDTVWRAITDNTGKAELWANFSTADSSQGIYNIICRKETLHYPATFENGINRLTLKTSCSHSGIANIAFVVDATGSMGDEIKYLQNELNDVIANASAKNKDVKLRTGAVFYRDRNRNDEYLTRFIDFQSDPAPLMQFINEQSAKGGGDYQEAVEDALTAALGSMHWESDARAKIVFLILDAPPHDAAKEKMKRIMMQAAAMGVRIVPIVCSGVDKSTEYLMRSLALATNGSYVFLTDDSGVGDDHIKPTTDDYKVELLNDLLQRVIAEMVYIEPCDDKEKPEVPVTANNNAKVTVYPNPTTGRIQIKTDEAIKELYITDFTGKMLERINADLNKQVWQTDLSRYPSGTYLIRYFTGQKGWGTEKVLLIK
jgi:hypothetical protein